MRLRVVTWNINRRNPERVWDVFEQTDIPTVFLLQEVQPSAASTANLICSEVGMKKGKVGILAKDMALSEIKLDPCSHPSAVIAATITPPDSKRAITFISLYGLIERGYSITTLHRIFSDLTPLLDPASKRVVIGGDFNASKQWDERQPGKSHEIMFNRLENFDLVNCVKKHHSDYVRTWRSRNELNTPWQLDHLFASNNLAEKLVSCEVLENEMVIGVSDHNPIVAIFDL